MAGETQAVQSEADWDEDTMCLMLSSFSLNVLETSLTLLSSLLTRLMLCGSSVPLLVLNSC